MEALADRYSLGMVALTCGERGSVLLAGGRAVRSAAPPAQVVDTVGAGARLPPRWRSACSRGGSSRRSAAARTR